jgi:hypothetical protein
MALRKIISALWTILFSIVFFTFLPAAASSIPHFFNYQGRLMTSGGTNVADGSYSIKFSLYTQASGGTPIWTALGSVNSPTALNITVTNGLFSVLLGDPSFQSQNPLTNVDWNQDSLYLGITVGSDSEMTPRKKLSAVPFAFNSEQLQGQYASSSATSTGGALFAIHQTAADAASAQRTALSIKTEGTSNLNDFLIVGKNDASDVFTVSRQGNVTTTGNLAANGSVTLGDAATDNVVFNAHVLSDVLPSTDLAYRLGDTSHRWLGLDVGTVTTTNLYATTVSSTNGLFTNATTSWMGATTVSTTNLYVNGQAITAGVPATTATLQTITSNGASTTNLIYAFGGLNTSNLTATGTTSLQNTTFTNATASAVTSTNLFSTYGTVTTLGSTYFTATQATATTFAFTSASGSSLLVSGKSVCLQDGTNCPAVPAGSSIWTDNSTNGTIYNTTSSRDVLIGGSTTDTANFILDKSSGATSTVIIGSYTGNANLLVGTTTYGGGLNSNFVLNGNDVFVQGMLGSKEGLFSATGVTVGLGSTIYGDGNLYKTNAGDFTLTLNNAASNWRFRAGGSERLTVASSGNVGIGVTTPLEALDVSGTILNIVRTGTALPTRATSTLNSGAQPSSIALSGRYAYVANSGNDTLNVLDYSNPNSPVTIATTTLNAGATPYSLALSGRYAYVANSGNDTLNIVDISNPAAPLIVATTTFTSGSSPRSLALSGRYAYVANSGNDTLNIVDISNPAAPLIVATTTFTSVARPWSVFVQGNYAYVANASSSVLNMVDVSDPNRPVTVATTTFPNSASLSGVFVSGRYAYVAVSNRDLMNTVDVSNPAAPLIVATTTFTSGSNPSGLALSGRYAYVANSGKNAIVAVDVSNPVSPVIVATTTLTSGSSPRSLALSGRYAYVANSGNSTVSLIELRGVETAALSAASAELGSLSVLTNANIANQLSVGGGLNVGPGGLLSQGALAISATNTTSTFVFAVSTTYAEVSNRLTVGGVSVCLKNGTNCPAVPAGSSIWTDNSTNGTIYNTTSSRDVLIGGSTTDTANFILDKSSGATSTVIIGSYTGNANLLVGTTTYGGGLNTNFVLNGNDVFVQGMLGSKEGLFSATGVTVGLGSTIYGDGNLYKTNAGDFTLTLNNAASNWRFRAGGSERLTVASSGNVGIGVTTPLEALDVSGTILNIVRTGTALPTRATSTLNSGAQPSSLALSGRYAYVANSGNDTLNVLDYSNPNSPVTIATTTLNAGATPYSLALSGRYAYVANSGNDTLNIVDISNPAAPLIVATTTFTSGSSPRSLALSGRYAYVANSGNDTLNIVDISNPAAPLIVATTTFTSVARPWSVFVQGNYAYVANASSSVLNMVDVSDPNRPVTVATTTFPNSASLSGVFVSGRYAYVAVSNRDLMNTVDVSNPAAPLIVATTTFTSGSNPSGLALSGRYAYVANSGKNAIVAVDVSNPVSPVIVATTTLTSGSSPPQPRPIRPLRLRGELRQFDCIPHRTQGGLRPRRCPPQALNWARSLSSRTPISRTSSRWVED